ncbi:MAG: universal stress protein, partial [Nitrososphaeraceae archaeon]
MSQIKRKFSKVLAAIDGSQSSIDAAAYAAAMARKNNAQLIVLHILFSPLGYEYSSGKFGDETIPSSVKQIFRAAKNEAEQWFNKIKERTGEVIRTEVIVTDTSVAGAIIRYAEEHNVDLIVVGTRGRSAFTKLLLGSVASAVVTYAHCPVLL